MNGPLCSDAETVKKLSVEKHANLKQYFCGLEDYVLLYPDTKIIDVLPGSTEKFTVEKYKNFLGKPFQKISV